MKRSFPQLPELLPNVIYVYPLFPVYLQWKCHRALHLRIPVNRAGLNRYSSKTQPWPESLFSPVWARVPLTIPCRCRPTVARGISGWRPADAGGISSSHRPGSTPWGNGSLGPSPTHWPRSSWARARRPEFGLLRRPSCSATTAPSRLAAPCRSSSYPTPCGLCLPWPTAWGCRTAAVKRSTTARRAR